MVAERKSASPATGTETKGRSLQSSSGWHWHWPHYHVQHKHCPHSHITRIGSQGRGIFEGVNANQTYDRAQMAPDTFHNAHDPSNPITVTDTAGNFFFNTNGKPPEQKF